MTFEIMKKTISLILALILAVALLAGCGKPANRDFPEVLQ